MALSRESARIPRRRQGDRIGLDRARPRRPWSRFRPRPMANRAYRRVFASGLAGYPGRFADITVVAWLVVERTHAPLAVALIIFFRYLPFLVVGPFVGVALDRLPLLHIIRAWPPGLP